MIALYKGGWSGTPFAQAFFTALSAAAVLPISADSTAVVFD